MHLAGNAAPPKDRDMSQRLYKRPDSENWSAIIRLSSGHTIRKTTGCRDRKAAERVAQELERQAADPASGTTLGQALEAMLAETKRRGRAEKTLDFYRQKVGHYVRLWGVDMPLARVDARLVDEYIDQRQKEGASPHTIQKELVALRKTLRLAIRYGDYAKPLEAVLPAQWNREYKPRERWLPPDEVEALLHELRPHRAAHIAYLVATAARDIEAQRARVDDIDFAAGLVRLHGSKTERADRTIPITHHAGALLRWALEQLGDELRSRGGLLFRPWGDLRNNLRRACKRLGIAPCSPNDLRRTCGVWLRASGVPLDQIAAYMGHADSRMVERVYARLQPEQLARLMMEAMNGRRDDSMHYGRQPQPCTVELRPCGEESAAPIATARGEEPRETWPPECSAGTAARGPAMGSCVAPVGPLAAAKPLRVAGVELVAPARREPGVSNVSAPAERSERGERQEGGQMTLNAVPRVGIEPTTRGFSIRAVVDEKCGVRATNPRLRRAA